MTDQLAAAMRNAMMIDAAHQRDDAKFYASCEAREPVPEAARLRRIKWMKAYNMRPERRARRNTQRRTRRQTKSLLTRPGNGD
jgi:hypothetical protein